MLKIELNGVNAGTSAFGLTVSGADAGGTTIKGLVINRFGDDGVFVKAPNTTVEGNFIGANADGDTDLGNGADGVQPLSSGNTVGGPANTAQNVISGNDANGVILFDNSSTGNTTGNPPPPPFIGTDVNGTADLGNFSDGVHLEGNVSQTEVAGNTISGSTIGVEILGEGATGNEILGNFIGTNANNASNLGNSGFGVFVNAPGNFIGKAASGQGNTIAFNGQDGVIIAGDAATENRILRNSIFSNGGLGIDLIGGTENAAGATANDVKDPDTGSNKLQNFPVITSATTAKVKSTLNSRPRRSFTVQLFSNSQNDPSSFGEGETFLGQKTVRTNRRGKAFFAFVAPLSAGQFVTATATDSVGNTSEFQRAREVA